MRGGGDDPDHRATLRSASATGGTAPCGADLHFQKAVKETAQESAGSGRKGEGVLSGAFGKPCDHQVLCERR